jgi:hypothetical protein
MWQFYPTLRAGAWSELGFATASAGWRLGTLGAMGAAFSRPPAGTTPLVEEAIGYPPGRRAPRQSSAELACGLVNVSSDLRDRLRARGIDPGRLVWPPPVADSAVTTFGGLADEVHQVIRLSIGKAFTEGAEWIGVPQMLDALADLPQSSGARWFRSIPQRLGRPMARPGELVSRRPCG